MSSDGCESSCPVGSSGRKAWPVSSTRSKRRFNLAVLASSSTQDTLAPPRRRFAKASIAAAGSTPTTRRSGFLASAAATTPVAQPRSSIARRLRQITARIEILGPAILNVVKSKDCHDGRTRSFRRSNGRRHWPNQASHFSGGRAAKWATYKSSKMTARRSRPASGCSKASSPNSDPSGCASLCHR